ncbi:MAG: TetR/AcrR family transcriptional regulator [Eubacterium sp.]|nr:TetR/AcrR family transcriptional regulator [Eubacterium sp.]
MKRKVAKEILADSFRELAGEKHVDKITIQDIVVNCGYSPATFYRNFTDKYDLIAWSHAKDLAQIMKRIDGEEYTWRQAIVDGMYLCYEEREYLSNLFSHTSGQDSFVRYMIENHCSAMEKYILSAYKKDMLTIEEEMLMRTYCMGATGLLCEWVFGAYQVSYEEAAEVIWKALPKELESSSERTGKIFEINETKMPLSLIMIDNGIFIYCNLIKMIYIKYID